MGKGGSAPTSQTVEQTNLPEYVRPQFERLLARAESQSLAPYTPYSGERIAQPGQDIGLSYDITRDVATSGVPGLPQAMDVVAQNVLQGIDIAAGTTPYQYDPTQTFTGEAVGQYMSPYMQQVLDVRKEQARRQFEEQGAGRAAKAMQAGAFGGSRQAVQEAIAERELLNRMADIQATGQQQAFESAQQAFQADRSAMFGREQAQAGEDRAARAQQLQALGFTAGQAQQMVDMGETARAADIQGAQLLEAIGKAQQGMEQEGLDIAYQDFLRQQGYPEQQLQFLSSILRGVPVQPGVTTTGYAPYDPMQELLGAGLAGLSLYRGLSG
jgi:hypothetical protein